MSTRPQNWPAAPAPGIRLIAGRPISHTIIPDELEVDDSPEGDVLTGLKRLAFVLVVLLIVFAAALLSGRLLDDGADAVLTSKLAAEAADRKAVTPEQHQRVMSMPLRHDATVTMSGPDIAEPRTRFYFLPENRK